MMTWALSSQKLRYAINGAVAAIVHFLVLYAAIHFLDIGSAGLSNLLGSLAGIAASYAGNRHFVYRQTRAPVLVQGSRFVVLYAVLAAMHGLVLLIWTDWWGLNYLTGFLITVLLQVAIGYLGNKHLVFNRPSKLDPGGEARQT
jgi:putative flippase GtrA